MTVTEVIRMLIVALDEGHVRPDAIVKVYDPETRHMCPVNDGMISEWEISLEARKVGK